MRSSSATSTFRKKNRTGVYAVRVPRERGDALAAVRVPESQRAVRRAAAHHLPHRGEGHAEDAPLVAAEQDARPPVDAPELHSVFGCCRLVGDGKLSEFRQGCPWSWTLGGLSVQGLGRRRSKVQRRECRAMPHGAMKVRRAWGRVCGCRMPSAESAASEGCLSSDGSRRGSVCMAQGGEVSAKFVSTGRVGSRGHTQYSPCGCTATSECASQLALRIRSISIAPPSSQATPRHLRPSLDKGGAFQGPCADMKEA